MPFSSVSHSMSRIGLNMLNTACSMHICSFNTSDAEFVHLAVSSLNTWEPMQATPAHEAKAAKAAKAQRFLEATMNRYEATMTCCASSHIYPYLDISRICPHATAWLIFSWHIDAHLLFGYSAKVWRLCTLAMDPVEARAMPLPQLVEARGARGILIYHN